MNTKRMCRFYKTCTGRGKGAHDNYFFSCRGKNSKCEILPRKKHIPKIQWENVRREVHELREALGFILSEIFAIEAKHPTLNKEDFDGPVNVIRAALENCKELI